MSRSKETGFKYSDAYHSFFEGYSELKDPATGRIRRVYTSDYYKADISNGRYVLIKSVYIFLLLAAAACLILPMLLKSSIDKAAVSPVFQCLCMVIIVVNAVKLIMYVTAPRNLTKGEFYQNSVRLRLYCLIGTGCFCGLFITYAIWFFMNIKNAAATDIFIWAATLIGSLCFLMIFQIERRIDYTVIDNSTAKPEGSVEIWR